MKKFRNEQKHLAQRRRGAESTKKIKQLFISNLCASASLREIVNFFTRSKYRFPFMPAKRLGKSDQRKPPAKLTLLHIGVNPSLNREILRFSPFTSAPQYGNYSSNLPGALASGGQHASYRLTESKWAGLGSQMACRWSGCSHGASAPATLYSPGKISHIDGPHGALHAWLSRRSGRRTTRSLR